MPPFKDEQIIIIAPGSQSTLAQLGLPESFTPARLRVKSRLFPAEKEGEWEPYKVRRKAKDISQEEIEETNEMKKSLGESEEEVTYEEDPISEEGAVWPIVEGRIANWECFFALMTYVYNTLNPPFHTPILLITQPAWTPKDHERLTQFFFEKFKVPAFAIMDSALATSYAYGVHTATVVDVGLDKADITAVSEFLVRDTGRAIAIPDCGGESMTQRLLELLSPKGFTREMCEQLKKSPVCEILPQGVPLPGTEEPPKGVIVNPAAAASTGADGSGPGQRHTAAAMGEAPRGPGPDTEVGDDLQDEEDNEGVLDVASIVAGGKMNEYLAKKEREKAEKLAAKKKGAETAAPAARQARLPNSKRERNTFLYEDHALSGALKDMNLNGKRMAEARAALDEGPQKRQKTPEHAADHELPETNGEPKSAVEVNGTSTLPSTTSAKQGMTIRREIEVGVERFQAASGGILERIADAIHRTISSVEEVAKRSELWDSLIIVGNGAKVRGFKEALTALLTGKYLISPSSATIFTSELPSNLSTPAGTGANTPQPQLGPHGGGGSHVNPLLLAATTAQNPYLNPANLMPSLHTHTTHSSHGQTPTSIKLAKVPEYFPEWKEVGYDEAAFLGAQVAAKVLFVVDQGLSKGFMTRSDYNDAGPTAISDYSL